MTMKKIFILAIAMTLVAATALAQAPQHRSFFGNLNRAKSGASTQAELPPKDATSFNWVNTPSEMVLEAYCDRVGKTPLIDPNCPKNVQITLKSPKDQQLTNEEYLEAIKAVLEMNGIHIEDYQDSFVRALPRKDVRKEGIPLLMDADAKLGDSVNVVSMMISFENMSVEDAQKVLEGFKSNSGLLISFERTNKILVTDTEQNIKRMVEIAKAIDVAIPATEQSFVRQIKNASVSDIKTVLDQIVQDSQKLQEQQKQPANRMLGPTGPRGFLGRSQNQKQPAAPTSTESMLMSVSDADRGIIRGRVTIVAEERSNKLVVITSKSNMDFFDKVIESLDVETTPDTVVKVYRLKYADAEDVSDMINDLIGNASSSKSSTKNSNQTSKKGSGGNLTNNRTQTAPKKSVNQRSGEAKAGELSKDNTTVLADKRINGIVVMTDKELVPTVESIIESMDIKLSQVLIETVIIEVQLGDDISTGIDWVHGIRARDGAYRQALGGGGGSSTIAGAAKAATNLMINAVGNTLPYLFTPGGAGLTYGVFSESLNLGAVIQAAKTDSRSKYLASPVVMTVDNKEATIDATQKWQFLTGYQVSSSVYTSGNSTAPQYSAEELGIKIKVTPKINPNGTVMLEVEEEYSQLGAKQTILDPQSNEKSIDTMVKRQMSADVLLENRQTVVLGGLTETQTSEESSGIPILKDIPWIGKYLFGSTSSSEKRNELLVFMTPYVLSEGEAAQFEALRRKKALSDPRPWDDHGWSDSQLADPVEARELLRRMEDEWKKQDEEHEVEKKIEKMKTERVEKLRKQAEKEAAAETAAQNERAKMDAEKAKKPDAVVEKLNEGERPEDGVSLLSDVEAR